MLSFLRYSLTVVGSGLRERHLQQWDTCILNPLARKMAGVGQSARLPILHTVSGTMLSHNLYSQTCGEMINRSPRAHKSSIRDRLSNWLLQAYKVKAWEPELKVVKPLAKPEGLQPIGRLRYIDYDVPLGLFKSCPKGLIP